MKQAMTKVAAIPEASGTMGKILRTELQKRACRPALGRGAGTLLVPLGTMARTSMQRAILARPRPSSIALLQGASTLLIHLAGTCVERPVAGNQSKTISSGPLSGYEGARTQQGAARDLRQARTTLRRMHSVKDIAQARMRRLGPDGFLRLVEGLGEAIDADVTGT
jgi:hypothetical protein